MWVPKLGELAVRIFHTPANSVPSERAFCTCNLMHDKKQNRLSTVVTDQLCYIHVNKHILDRQSGPSVVRSWRDLDEKELASIEHEMFGNIESPEWNLMVEGSNV